MLFWFIFNMNNQVDHASNMINYTLHNCKIIYYYVNEIIFKFIII